MINRLHSVDRLTNESIGIANANVLELFDMLTLKHIEVATVGGLPDLTQR